MAKIYNEIVIDMNPESSTFEEVLHEDSYEYDGDMLLAQELAADELKAQDYQEGQEIWLHNKGQEYWKNKKSGNTFKKTRAHGSDWENEWVSVTDPETGEKKSVRQGTLYTRIVKYPKLKFESATRTWKDAGLVATGETGGMQSYKDRDSIPDYYDPTSTEYGAQTLTSADFLDPSTKEPLPVQTVIENLYKRFPNKDPKEIQKQVMENMPQYEGVDKKKQEFARADLQEDVYGLQKQAGAAGAAMQSAYGGMGTSMRGGLQAQADLQRGIAKAERGYEETQYGLEKQAEKDFESDISSFIAGWREGGLVHRGDPRVKNKISKTTFLDILSKIPDAGGI